jgi:hypothetical protein
MKTVSHLTLVPPSPARLASASFQLVMTMPALDHWKQLAVPQFLRRLGANN